MKKYLLITSTIRVNPGTKYVRCANNTNKRLLEYKKSLQYLLANSVGIDEIIYCDNSGFTDNELANLLSIDDISSATSPRVTIINVPNIPNIHKGPGEELLLKYGIKHISEINKESDNVFIVKISGRVKFPNFNINLFNFNSLNLVSNFEDSGDNPWYKYMTWMFGFPISIAKIFYNELDIASLKNPVFEDAFKMVIDNNNFNISECPYLEIVDSFRAATRKPYKMNNYEKI